MIPSLIPPLLNEVGVTLGQPINLVQSDEFKFHSLCSDRILKGLGRIQFRQGPDIRKAEEPFGIGF